MADQNENRKDDGGGVKKSPQEARGGKIILRQPWQRWGLLIGAAAAIIIALLFAFGIAV